MSRNKGQKRKYPLRKKDHPSYGIWKAMRKRCNNRNAASYKNYGGRGIYVDARWNVFENFLADMGERPAGMELDRIDNDGPYSRENCRWATRTENQRNKRTNRSYTYKGKTRSLSEIAEIENLNYFTLRSRVYKLGMEIDVAVNWVKHKKQ